MKGKSILAVLVCLFLVFTARGQNSFTVNEAKSNAVLLEKSAEISLFVENPGKSFAAKIALELLDTDGKIRANTAKDAKIKRGKSGYKISLPLGDLMAKAENEISWYRLNYKISDSGGNVQTAGIVSLSEFVKDIFEIRIAASEQVFSGMNYRVRVRALQPFTKAAVKNVKIEGELRLDIDTEADEDELNLKAKGKTDGEGFALLDFKIPANVKLDDDGDLRVTGRKNGIVREIDEELDSDDENKGTVFLTTDKPLYQPGQDFKMRGLYLDANNTVVPGSQLEFKILDEDDTVLYKETLATSSFGIASVAWKIPENAKLGDYRVEIENEDGDELGYQSFKVSRYDLPNFSVTVTPDKTFYLPADKQAEIAVTADYLFGKPVTKGKVRVVQESERRWNWREQKYDVEEKEVFEGAADVGKFIARVDLSEEISDLLESSWRRFEDLNFSAYYTDLTTNKTEQRRFDIRLTKEPIHIYFIRHDDNNPNLPVTAYVSTFYADGSPAICETEIEGEGKIVARIKTNSYGAGKIEFNVSKDNSEERYYDLKITARDRKGQRGTFEEEFYLEKEDAVKIETDKTIFKAGEPVRVNLVSTQKEGFVYVDVVKDWATLDSYLVNLKNGKADLRIPYNPNFKGELTIAVYGDDNENYWDTRMRASRGIIFPEQQNLKLEADFEKAVFSPNEEAKVKFSVWDGIGKAVESALGVVVFDKAVEERARTDAEFGSYFSRYFSLLGYSKSFGSVTLKDLNEINLSKPVPAEMQLVAEVMLANNHFYPRIYRSHFNQTEAKSLFAEFFKKQFAPVEEILKKQFEKNYAHPTDENSLRKILAGGGINFDDLRDPWGNNYQAVFTVDKTQNIVTIKTAGANKKFETKDDFEVSSESFAYFTPVGKAIDKTVEDYHRSTGKYIRDAETLRAELARAGLDLDEIKDRFNRDYRITFEVLGRNYLIRFYSLGANGIYESDSWNRDDFEIWKTAIDYFYKTEIKINEIFSQTVNNGKRPFPQDETEFKRILQENGLPFENIKDGYGETAYLVFSKFSRYADKKVVENNKQTITPVTEEVMKFTVRSKGAEPSDARDDFDLATFSGVLNVRSKETKYETKVVKTITFSGAYGAIRGTVFDPNGAVIPGATVTATSEGDSPTARSTLTNDEGEFLFENLPSGRYSIRIEASGFKLSVYQNIEVRSQNLVEMKVTVDVGTVSETVTVASEAEVTVNASASRVQTTVKKADSPIIKSIEPTSTPRLREYFPETLVWNPELVTDKNGKAELKFKMADNITTWKLYTVASTKNGKIGVAEKEIQAFQPFFVDLEPPKFLTEGDEIFLPTQIRNYTEKRQKVDVSMNKGDWFSFLNSERQQIEVAPNAAENAVFGFRADAVVKEGRQRVTAIAAKDSDAIEKPVTVRPNGQEIVKAESKLFKTAANFDINFPAAALPKTPRAEVKIYPNLFSHVAESVEGLLQRPYGCGEQTISSAYPNLMILKFSDGATMGQSDNGKNLSSSHGPKVAPSIRDKAKKYLQKGYERLLGYQVADGGFSYWGGKDSADIALTAYAIRFLNDAKDFIETDETVIKRAQDWLIRQQRADGSWTRKYSWENSEDATRTKLFTSYVARTLAMQNGKDKSSAKSQTENEALQKALAYLRARNAEIDEPYALALFGLASLDAGNLEDANSTAERLEKMAHSEGNAVYWNLETNTPFYGWGTAGRIETTALVVQLFAKLEKINPKSKIQNPKLNAGTMFLLKNKDRYGVWYSTQTTINVLDAFLATLGDAPEKPSSESASGTIQILLNGETLQNVSVSPDQLTPIILDLNGKLNAAANRLEIKSSSNSSVMSQIVQAHYIDWRNAEISNQNTNQSRQIRLDYKCDKSSAEIMQDVTCSVEAERVGFKGYGMLLAEIGLPPGADVSRESLQAAMDADSSLSRYDVLPDRIILYMWARAGGTKFNFKFRPRYGINAQTPASIVYDYYNEEAKATIAPLKFSVK